MRKIILFILLFILLFVIILFFGCIRDENFCVKDSDCIISGCNGEICANKPLYSICLWKPEYGCLKFSKCKCINFRCQWQKTKDYEDCLKNITNEKGI